MKYTFYAFKLIEIILKHIFLYIKFILNQCVAINFNKNVKIFILSIYLDDMGRSN